MSKKQRHTPKKKYSKTAISVLSFVAGATLIGLYIYTGEETVALGGLVAHLWLVSLAAVEA